MSHLSPRDPSDSINWSAYPALLFSGCIGAGILTASTTPLRSPLVWMAGAVTAAVLTLLTWDPPPPWTSDRHAAAGTIGLFLLGICTGAARYNFRHSTPSYHLVHRIASPSTSPDYRVTAVRGTIESFPLANSRYIRFILQADTIYMDARPVPTTGKLQVTLWTPSDSTRTGYPALEYHQTALITGSVRSVAPPGNPAEFDYQSYLARRNIHHTISVSDPDRITVLKEQTSPVAYVLATIRAYVTASIDKHIPTKQARALLSALLLGDRSRITTVTKRRFQQTGLMHLLAISGLHVMIIGLVFYNLLLPLLKRLRLPWKAMEWTRSTVTVGILLIYCLVSGAPPSVVRALVMTVLVLGGVLAQRTYLPLNALGAAGIVLLSINPDQLFDAGFQLSFAAVGGILTITPTLNRLSPSRPNEQGTIYYLKNTLFASTAATLATMPVTLFHFGQVALGGLLLNLAAIPITAVILSGAVATVVFHGAVPTVATAVGMTTDRAIHCLLYTASSGDRLLHWTLVETFVTSPLTIMALVSGLLALILWHRPHVRWRWTGLSLLLLTSYLWLHIVRIKNDRYLDVIYFDVGHGDAALIELPNDRHVVIDGGNRSRYVDHGMRTIIPHLRRYDIDRLEAVVISHPHSDHMGGLLTTLEEVSVGRVIYNGQQYSSAMFKEMRALADSLQINLEAVAAGDTLVLDPAVRVQVLAPLRAPAPDMDPNEASVVLRIVYREISFLFTGDIERGTERELVKTYGSLLSADVIKVPHHGSETSSTPGFVRRTTAVAQDDHTAVISVGRGSLFNLPDDYILTRWRTSGARIRQTTGGAVWLRTAGHRLRNVSWE